MSDENKGQEAVFVPPSADAGGAEDEEEDFDKVESFGRGSSKVRTMLARCNTC
jgi:hypothetical protein